MPTFAAVARCLVLPPLDEEPPPLPPPLENEDPLEPLWPEEIEDAVEAVACDGPSVLDEPRVVDLGTCSWWNGSCSEPPTSRPWACSWSGLTLDAVGSRGL